MKNYIKIGIDDYVYPTRLKKIRNSPKKLYMKGNLNLLNRTTIAIVGSRDCTGYGFKQAYEFAKELSKKEICVVSGLAEGIDTAAHLGAMHQKGNTIAILGSGFNKIFPEENAILAESIIKNEGLIITEYDLYEESKSENFPKRNRIMNGLSCGILVIEAKRKSGTLITARYAKEENKEVFCLPSNIDNKTSGGTNQLIKDGATLVTDVNNILGKIAYKQKNSLSTYKINSEYKDIYELLTDIPMSVNEIARKTNTPIEKTNEIITMLEIEGLIKNVPNNQFVKG